MSETESFPDRIKRLRDAKEWSQTELAEQADLAPAALSRILGGSRHPRMEHLIALAGALDSTVTELVVGTGYEAVIEEWVPRDRFEKSEVARVELAKEAEVARAEAAARQAELESFRANVESLTTRVQDLERDLGHTRADAQRADGLSREVARLQRALNAAEAERDRARAQGAACEHARDQAIVRANHYHRGWEEAVARVQQLRQDLLSARSDRVAVGAVAAILGGVGGAFLASRDDET
jgi:transcriptional regulator with XRE-family HTH domain